MNLKAFEGIIVPLVTPLSETGDLDSASLKTLIKHVRDGGANGIFILGSTGEGPSLNLELRRQLIHETCRIVDGGLPILIGVTDSAIDNVIAISKEALKAKADAIALAPPPYFAPSQEEFLRYVHEVSSKVSIPIFLYNNPKLTKMNIEPETVLEAAKMEAVIGIKDSSGSLEYFDELTDLFSSSKMILLMGTDELLAESLGRGAHGGVCGMANLFPKLFSELYGASKISDGRTVLALHEEIVHIRSSLFNQKYRHSSAVTTLKCALSKMALCKDFMAPPLYPASPDDQERIFEKLRSLV